MKEAFKADRLDESVVERYRKHRAGKQCIQRGDRAALKRLLTVLRDAGMAAPAPLPPFLPEDQVFAGSATICDRNAGWCEIPIRSRGANRWIL
ncbi:hypothetical protein BQ8482_300003 [Mesorhizobium delmotii]|uniref:Uncharacterized protein n=1 Tax=Mesorhizobium delmotii TaxID=1631247 RepID=A0A2P9AND2_9HYPH|nr:hypothetical protein BQ8482_300003 [Mesorhizobium delmotii]